MFSPPFATTPKVTSSPPVSPGPRRQNVQSGVPIIVSVIEVVRQTKDACEATLCP